MLFQLFVIADALLLLELFEEFINWILVLQSLLLLCIVNIVVAAALLISPLLCCSFSIHHALLFCSIVVL